MAQKRIKHTDQEWFDLITECRTSKLKVKDWCKQHGITAKALYYHTRQLRQKGYTINVNNLTQATTTYCIFTFNWHGVPCAFLHSRPLTQLKYCTNFSSKNQQIYY